MRFFILLLTFTVSYASAPPKILVTLKPIHSIVENLTQGVTTPELLLDANTSPHSFHMTPSMTRKIKDADLIIWVGPNLEGPLAKLLRDNPDAMPLISYIQTLSMRESGHQHSHDPHFWLSPKRMRAIVPPLTELLIERDPNNAQKYTQNAADVDKELARLDRDIKDSLQDVNSVAYLTFHDGYQYLESDYGLNGKGSIIVDSDIPLSPLRLHALKQKIADNHIHCIFSEPQFANKVPRYLMEDTHLHVTALDPLGIDTPAGKSMYFNWLRKQVEIIRSCLTKN